VIGGEKIGIKNENNLTITFPLGVWVVCTAIAVATYYIKIDIGFWPGFFTWGVFVGGIVIGGIKVIES
jgi:hypothetical protein